MKATIATKPSKQAASTAIIVRVDLQKMLTPDELKNFQEKAAEAGRTVREHFLAITIGARSHDAA